MSKSKNGVEMSDYKSVPQSDPERRIATNKYTVNKSPKGVRISRPVFMLLMAGVVLLVLGAVLITFFLVPRCSDAVAQSELQNTQAAHVCSSKIGNIRANHQNLRKNYQNWDERLPKALRPTHYRLKLMPFIFPDNFTTNGEVTITLNCTEDTDKIVFNINDIEIHEKFFKVTEIKKGSTLDIPTKEFMYETDKQRLTVVVNNLMLAGNQYEVFIKFTGHLNNLLQGFYRISYYDYQSKTIKWMAATQFSPTDARRAFPCFDEPSMKARFTISLARNASMNTRSNMEIKETASVSEMPGWVWDHYHTTPVMSTYLVAMVVSELQPFNYSAGNLKFTIWSRPEALQQTRYAGLIGPKILNYFEEYFQIKYPLPKLDLMALPDFGFNAMENWGLITFREAALLFNPDSSPIKNKRQIATVLSHELGHQWFGNLVTPEWWEDLWLKEGFATYTQYLGVNKVQPTWNIMDEMVLSEIQKSFAVDGLLSSHPIHVTVNTTDHIRQIFDPISYSKGASIIRMINHFLGEYTFKVGLVNYLNQKKYSNAYHDDLWNSLTSQGHLDRSLPQKISIKEIMDTWILQSGYPVINVTRDYQKNTATLSQHRFLLSGELDLESKWWIPISFTTMTEKDFENTKPKIWMTKDDKEIILQNLPAENEWFYVNIKNVGYYRVNYDVDNWRLIGANFHEFPPASKAQLVDDAFNLARAGYLDYHVPLNLAYQMFTDPYQPYVPLEATFDGLEYLDNMLATTSTYGNFKVFLSKIMDRIFKGVGFMESLDDTYDVQMKRPSILKWACRLESSDCTIQARRLFRNWMAEEHGHNPITPNLKEVVYCTAIREGAEPEWEFAFEKFQKSTSAAEKEVLLKAMGCASEPWLLSRYLKLILGDDNNYPQIRKQDGSAVFQNVAKNIIGYQLAFDFLRNNWEQLNEYYGPAFSVISKMVGVLPTYMNTEYQLRQLEMFRDDHAENLVTSERAIDQAIEKVQANVNWMKNSYKRVDEWLSDTLNKFIYKK